MFTAGAQHDSVSNALEPSTVGVAIELSHCPFIYSHLSSRIYQRNSMQKDQQYG